MKIITVNLDKGGTGKSTISFALASYISEIKNQKVCLIDGDRSCNLSHSFSGLGNSTVANIFLRKEVEIYSVSENLDIIKGSRNLDDHTLNLKSKQNNCLLFFMWIADNLDRLEKYDYIIIDTHNDESLVTRNFLAVADIVLAVSEPSRNSYRACLQLVELIEKLKTELIDIRTRETYVNAKFYFIANNVNHLGNSGKNFLEVIEHDPKYLGMIQSKELIRDSLISDTSIFQKKKKMSASEKERHNSFYEHIESLFEKIINL